MRFVKKVLSGIEKVFSVLVAIGFVGVGFCVIVQILARYIPGLTANWTDELARLLFFYTLMFGAPIAFAHNEYAFIDVIITKLTGRARHIANAAIYALCSFTAAMIFFNSFKFFKVGKRTLSTVLGVQMTWFYGPVIGIFAFSMVAAGLVVIREIILAAKGEDAL